jgi:hypothetical protein
MALGAQHNPFRGGPGSKTMMMGNGDPMICEPWTIFIIVALVYDMADVSVWSNFVSSLVSSTWPHFDVLACCLRVTDPLSSFIIS